MNKKPIAFIAVIFSTFLLMNSNTSSAQIFGADDEDLTKIGAELKKLNTHLANIQKSRQIQIRKIIDQLNAQNKRLEDTNSIIRSELIPVIQDDLKNLHIQVRKQNKGLKEQQEDLLRHIEEIKQVIPQLMGAMDQNKAETLSSLNRTNLKISDLEAEVKIQVLDKINQQNEILDLFRTEQKNLKEGLAQDIEKFEQSSKSSFQGFSIANQKSLETFSAKNQKLNESLIEILKENLKQGIGINQSIADLRRKANVNISRNDEIKKALKQFKKDN